VTADLTSSPVAEAAGELLRERDRVVQRLRSMALDAIPTDLVLAQAQRLADLAAEHLAEPIRPVPSLAPYAAGDQLVVLVGELTTATTALPEGRAVALVTEAREALVTLRAGLTRP
jgi:hypothetical protein